MHRVAFNVHVALSSVDKLGNLGMALSYLVWSRIKYDCHDYCSPLGELDMDIPHYERIIC